MPPITAAAFMAAGGGAQAGDGVVSLLTTLYSPLGTLTVAIGAYGLLWYMVKSVNARL